MKHSTYRYNSTTCRYEPVPRSIKNILRPLLIFLAVSSTLFLGLLYLHSSFLTTEEEQVLKHKNQALNYHLGKLSDELVRVKVSLASLNVADKNVQRKLATDKTPVQQPVRAANVVHHDFNLKKFLKNTRAKTTALLQQANSSNHYFGNSITITPKDLVLLTNIPSLQPINSKELTKLASGYGVRVNPFHKGNYFHRGIDFVAPRGSFVLASASGRISEVKTSALEMGDGNVIEIDHENGFKTRYAHLGSLRVKPGQYVTKGSVIASIGMTGGSVSPHLHFEVLKNNKHVDPIGFILESSTSTDYSVLVLYARQKNQSLD